MPVKFNPFTGQLQIDEKGSGGGSSYIDGEVAAYGDLSLDAGVAPLNSAWLVREASGTWLLGRKPAGIYIRTATAGVSRDVDYTYAGILPDVFSDANFTLYDESDSTKNAKFQLSGIATGTTRTITVPNKNVTLDDAGDSRTPLSHAASHASAGSDPLFDQDLNTTDNPTFADVYVGSLTADGSSQSPPTADSCSVTPQGFEFIGTAAATTRTNLGLGTAATAATGDFAAASHAHGNLTSSGAIGSTAGLPVVTTTSGAVTTLALGTANQVLRVNSGATGVEFADPAASGVTGAASSASDVLGVSGANITGVDANADRIVFWDDSASALKHLTVGSGLSLTDTTLTATGGGVTTGSVDNAILRADGTGGSTSQSSDLVIEDFTTTTQRNVALRANRARFSITADAATDVITATGSSGSFSENDPVVFPTLTGGAGLSTITRYFVRDISGDTFKVSTSSGGAAVNITTNYTGGTVELQTALVLSGSHMGGIIAGPKPDGTALGGNARGARGVVDLQHFRTAATQVASGDLSVICGGLQNTASGTASFIGGGENNTVSGTYSGALGRTNTVSGGDSFCFGQSNTVSGAGPAHCFGNTNTASAVDSMAVGHRALSDRATMHAFACGNFAATGDSQHINAVLRGTTTTNSAVELFMGTAANVRLTIPSSKVMFANIKIVGVANGGGTVATFERQYALKNVGGTVSEIYAPVTIGTDNAASTSITVDANDTNDALRIQCTGLSATTIRWVAHVSAVEVTHG